MPNFKFSYILAALFVATGLGPSALAQTANDNSTTVRPVNEEDVRKTPIRRNVQPITYWVDTASLNFRDNPVSGKILGKLQYGEKILAYSQYENWVRVSKSDVNPKWVNSDFLSNSRLSWASFNRSPSTRINDVVSARIKDPENRKKRIFGVRLKTAETGNALITTREETAEGIFYQNRFVSCDNQRPIGIKLIGEGRNFLSAQNDIRNFKFDIYDAKQIDDKAKNSTDTAISNFACKAQSF